MSVPSDFAAVEVRCEPDPPALWVVYVRGARQAQFETEDGARAWIRERFDPIILDGDEEP